MTAQTSTPSDASNVVETKAAELEGALANLSDEAAKYVQLAQDAIIEVRPLLDQSLKERPMMTLGAIAAVGFALGAIWRK